MTFEELAATSQHEFENVRREMATKEELRATEATILRAIESVDLHLASYASRWNEDFDSLDDHVGQIEGRVVMLEKPEGQA